MNGISPSTEDDCYEVRKSCGMVFQNPDNQIVTTIVEEDCAFGLENLGVEPKEIRRRVDDALRSVGMSDFAQASPAMLSGGQKQRVAVAGVLAMRPRIIVFDESTAMLDPIGRRDVFSLARRLNLEEGITVVWITHFMEEAALADRLVVMDGGRIALEGAPREVFAQTERVLSLGLDVPEMMKLAGELQKAGVKLPEGLITVNEMADEMAVELMPIEVNALTHVYMPGTPFEAKALNDVSLDIERGRVHRHHRPHRQRQEHADLPPERAGEVRAGHGVRERRGPGRQGHGPDRRAAGRGAGVPVPGIPAV